MMQGLLHLPRDPLVTASAIGYTTVVRPTDLGPPPPRYAGLPLGPDRLWPSAAALHMPLGFALYPAGVQAVHPRLMKTVECYHLTSGHPVVVERLLVEQAEGFVPYRLRYCHPHHFITPSLLYLDNVAQLHREFSGCELSVANPRLQALEVIRDSPAAYYEERVWALQQGLDAARNGRRGAFVDALCPNTLISQPVEDDLNTLLAYLTNTSLHGPNMRHGQLVLETVLGSNVLPHLPVVDPATARHLSGVLPLRALPTGGPGLFDLSCPGELRIERPDLTHFSPSGYRLVAHALDNHRPTDVDATIALSGGMVVGREVRHLIDRYASVLGVLDHHQRLDWLDEIARQTLTITGYQNAHAHLHPELLGDVRVRIRRSFADEALLELFVADGRCVHVVHLDLALLALCSLGITVSTTAPTPLL